ncbi:MAG: hypothetical protein MUP90_06985, partial [Gammaproteobacteria bacterium]|nr:hypothetical protein [Gammaproteobacteria bacterium]
MKTLKLTAGLVGALLLLLVTASAQEPVQIELDPEMPWFKVEIIVFRNLEPIPGEGEVFTPRAEPQVLSDAQVSLDGSIDTRMLDNGSSGAAIGQIQNTESADMTGNPPESKSVPEFSDQGDTRRSATEQTGGGLEITEPPTLEELYFPPGSGFRLVALEDLFPTETGGDLLEANLDRADNQSSVPPETPPQSTASLTESEAARHVLLHEFELTDQAKRIGNRKKYQLVAHVAWIQP